MSLPRRIVQCTLAQFGYRLVRSSPTDRPVYGVDSIFPLLKRYGFAPKQVIDVGANKGYWTRAALKYFPEASYTLIEPQDELKSLIQDLIDAGRKIRWINAGAADKPGTLPFAISYRNDSSTFMVDHEAHTAGFRRVNIEVRTLDEIVSTLNLPIPEMVKIDAEGFDLRVVSGASSLMGKTEIFFIEAAVRCSYENSVLEVVKRMDECGYDLLDVTDITRSPKYGVLWLFEFAFLRKGSHMLDSVASFE